MKKSQYDQILTALRNGARLTSLDALRMFGCFRLASRISDMKKNGVPIESETVKTDSGKRVSRYYMKQELF